MKNVGYKLSQANVLHDIKKTVAWGKMWSEKQLWANTSTPIRGKTECEKQTQGPTKLSTYVANEVS